MRGKYRKKSWIMLAVIMFAVIGCLVWVSGCLGADGIPPAGITNIHNVTFATTSVNWTWNDPADADFNKVMVYLNGVFKTNVTKGTRFYLATGLVPDTEYTLGTQTVDTSGNINHTWVIHTARTASVPDTTPPSGVTNLHNVTFATTTINWTWDDPADADFSKVIVYLNGMFKTNVTKGIRFYSATVLVPNTTYTLGTHTVDTSGNINKIWVNHTTKTAPIPVTPRITVVVPNASENWKQGSAQTIMWKYTGSPGSSVKIELLRGTAVNRMINSSISIGSGGSGSYSWTLPYNQDLGTDFKIRITSTSNASYNDTSNANFTISAGPPITIIVPSGGENWKQGSARNITWKYTGIPGLSVKIELLRGTAVNRMINSSISMGFGGSGSYRWTVPYNQTLGTDYKIRITSTSNTTYNDTSNANFTISAV